MKISQTGWVGVGCITTEIYFLPGLEAGSLEIQVSAGFPSSVSSSLDWQILWLYAFCVLSSSFSIKTLVLLDLDPTYMTFHGCLNYLSNGPAFK